ncbi:MAG: flippase [Terracidiphilus sp.]
MEIDEISSPLGATGEAFQELIEIPDAPSRAKTILWNFGWLGAGAAGSRLISLVTNAVLARRISTSGYGVTGIAQSITLYFGLVSDLGLGTVALREGAQNPGQLQRVISSMLGLRLALSVAASLLGLAVTPYLPFSESSRALFNLYLFTLPIQALSMEWVFRATQRMYWNTILQIVGAILTLLLTVALVRDPRDLLRVGGITAAVAAVAALLSIFVLRGQGYHAWPIFTLREARDYLGQSLPLCASSLAILLYTQANNLILGYVRGESDVGLYGAAIRLSQLFYQPIWLYFAAMVPALMQCWALSPEKACSMLSTSVRLTAITTIGFGLVAASAGPWLLVKIFGKPFGGSAAAFEILIWTGVIIAIGHNWVELTVAAKKNNLLVQSAFLGALVNLVVCTATVHRMGIRGAAVSNLLAEIAVPAYLIVALRKQVELRVLQAVTKPALAGAAAYGVFLATRWSAPVVCLALTTFSYVGILILTGGIGLLDLKRLHGLISLPRIAPEFDS